LSNSSSKCATNFDKSASVVEEAEAVVVFVDGALKTIGAGCPGAGVVLLASGSLSINKSSNPIIFYFYKFNTYY
jgi:hypothetical protein